MNEHLVLFFAIVVSVMILYRPVRKFLDAELSAYARVIGNDIDYAFDSKQKAYDAMVYYLERNKNLSVEAGIIISEARTRADEIKASFSADVDRKIMERIEYVKEFLRKDIDRVINFTECSAVEIAKDSLKLFMQTNYSKDKVVQSKSLDDFVSQFSDVMNKFN